MSKPLIDAETWAKATSLNEELKSAIMNPNTDFMTKLLFDSRQLVKKQGNEIPYWSNSIVKTKLLLMEKPLGKDELAKKLNIPKKDADTIIAYLIPMAEIVESEEKYSINKTNAFSKIFHK
ncbi:MAG: hypothetical protein COV47_06095 [Candidatus Diapherotrites archaeon CG11_big_fil_rev_8_21_14_0_20_37_9]|nr:MAG: hypothetical protein COV47_06095 [Candidatus Diapherotrites archaeon CG11_big_fil_rev_8_21_14_0_20_37_9]